MFSLLGFTPKATVFVEPSPVAVTTELSPNPNTCTNASTCNLSQAAAPFTKTTDVPLVAVKSVVGINLTPFNKTETAPAV